MENLFNLEIEKVKLDTSEIVLMKWNNIVIYEKALFYTPYEFRGKAQLTQVKTTVSKEHPDLSTMFYGCTNLESINTPEWDTSNVTTMNQMFGSCSSLMSLDLSSFDTSKVTDMFGMFGRCMKLRPLDLSNFNTDKVTDMAYMFTMCDLLTELDLSNFNTGKVTDMAHMFSYCNSLLTIEGISDWNISSLNYKYNHSIFYRW